MTQSHIFVTALFIAHTHTHIDRVPSSSSSYTIITFSACDRISFKLTLRDKIAIICRLLNFMSAHTLENISLTNFPLHFRPRMQFRSHSRQTKWLVCWHISISIWSRFYFYINPYSLLLINYILNFSHDIVHLFFNSHKLNGIIKCIVYKLDTQTIKSVHFNSNFFIEFFFLGIEQKIDFVSFEMVLMLEKFY